MKTPKPDFKAIVQTLSAEQGASKDKAVKTVLDAVNVHPKSRQRKAGGKRFTLKCTVQTTLEGYPFDIKYVIADGETVMVHGEDEFGNKQCALLSGYELANPIAVAIEILTNM
jgi:hypothetical protein